MRSDLTRHLLKPCSDEMKQVFGEALEAVLAAAQRPPSNEDSLAHRQASLVGMRRSFVTGAIILLIAIGIPMSAADGAAPDAKRKMADYEAQFARYLEVARATKADGTAPRWIDGLTGDPRAHNVNDLLTVKVVESINASGTADAALNKSSSATAGVSKLFGLESKVPSAIDPTNLATIGSDTKFKGGGTTTRTGELTTNLTVRVSEVLPNGDLVLEGAREILINRDRQILVLTGVVRPIDVGPGNVVVSTTIAQLRVQYYGNGLMRDSMSPGWLIRVLNKIF
jgi:flagellar L-ring protein FlgH